jgi:hypothetical protein
MADYNIPTGGYGSGTYGLPKSFRNGYDLNMKDLDSKESFSGWPDDLSSGHPPLSWSGTALS